MLRVVVAVVLFNISGSIEIETPVQVVGVIGLTGKLTRVRVPVGEGRIETINSEEGQSEQHVAIGPTPMYSPTTYRIK